MGNKVLIIFTGGTIAMKIDTNIGAAIPALNEDELFSMAKSIHNLVELESINFSNLPSPHITPNLMMDLANLVKENIQREDLASIVITHGTDTLEETAYLLDLCVDSPKPIVVTGAMRNFSELGYDGSSNLSAAICTAISPESRNKGVLVVMNNEVNSATEVTKTNTLSLNTFQSTEFGPLGIVDNDEVIYYRDIIAKQHIDTNKIETKVALIKAVPGMESDILDFHIDSGYKGIVIESLGRGNLPPEMIAGIQRAQENHIPIVMVSRCNTGRVLDSYGYEGGGRHLRKLGIIFGGNLPGQKIRIKLMLALGLTDKIKEIRNILERDIL